jgi:hypothetical protein
MGSADLSKVPRLARDILPLTARSRRPYTCIPTTAPIAVEHDIFGVAVVDVHVVSVLYIPDSGPESAKTTFHPNPRTLSLRQCLVDVVNSLRKVSDKDVSSAYCFDLEVPPSGNLVSEVAPGNMVRS